MKFQEKLLRILPRVHLEIVMGEYTSPVGENWNYRYRTDLNNLYYIMDGEGRIAINGQVFYPKPGQLVFFPKGARMELSTISSHTYTKYWTTFHAFVDDGDLFDHLTLPVCLDAQNPDEIEKQFKILSNHAEPPSPIGFLEKKAALYQLLADYFALCPEKDIQIKGALFDEKVQQVIRYIDQNLDKNLVVKDLAAMVYIHPTHLIRLFKSQVGTTPLEYINRTKMEKAKDRLLYSDHPISHIAAEIGMDALHFSNVFKKYFGVPPTVFRKDGVQNMTINRPL